MHQVPALTTPEPAKIDHRKLGMWIFLASEVMFFTALIAAAMNMKWRGPAHANAALNIPVTAVNTFVLIVSSTAVVLALSALEDGKVKTARNWMILTAVLGSTFVGIQVNEYIKLIGDGFIPSANTFASGFYAVTSFHGFHVFLGVVTLLWMLYRLLRGTLTPADPVPFETWGLYWHFVDVVWIVLFTILYLL
ncbi:MAG TPA: heme-copper oxidase subunit III [Anaerolineae bacterium]